MPAARKTSKGSLSIDWGSIAPLRLKARAIAEGIYAGMHRSVKKGAGVEFGGQRPYVPGDDLRFFDRRALLRHDRLMVREFETETDRAVWLCVDATASMAYRSERAPAAKLAFASLIAAATARVALATGDPVGLVFLGGEGGMPLPAMAGREAFDRVVGTLEAASALGEASDGERDAAASGAGARGSRWMENALAPVARRARRGAVLILLSDMIDLPAGALHSFASLGTHGRALIAVRVLDPAEVALPFEGTVRLRALEGTAVVEADADLVRGVYADRLATIAGSWSKELAARGGRFLDASTTKSPTDVVRDVVRAIAEARR